MFNIFKKSKLTFEDHVEILKEKLSVNPVILKDKDAKFTIKDSGGSCLQSGGFIHRLMDDEDKPINDRNIYNGVDGKPRTIVVVKKSKFIGTLAHEMRHAYQFENRVELNFDFSKDTKSIYKYLTCPKELDANIYALGYLQIYEGYKWTKRMYKARIFVSNYLSKKK